MSEDLELPYLRAKQQVRSRTVAGVLATCLATAVSTIAFLVREQRSDAEKLQIAAPSAELTLEISAMRGELRGLSERITRIETDRAIEAALRAAQQPGEKRR